MKEQLLREAIRKEIYVQLSEGKLIDLLVKLFFSSKIKKASKNILNDPDIQDAERAVEYAVENWKAAIKREEENRRDPEYIAAQRLVRDMRKKRLGLK